MNIFKNIWIKNLKKNQEPIEKFVDDVGPLIGKLSWKKFDSKTKKLVEQAEVKNAVTIGGKSAIIRLLAQGNSNKVGQVNPSDFKISKMRFGNAIGTTFEDLDLHYYDLQEVSARPNLMIPVVSGDGLPPGFPNVNTFPIVGAGGGNSAITPSPVSSPMVSFNATTGALPTSEHTFKAGNPITINLTGSSLFPELVPASNTNPARSPSFKSIRIEFFDSSSNLIGGVLFNTKYNKSINGNYIGSSFGDNTSILNNATSILFYDSIDKRWKLKLEGRVYNGDPDTSYRNHVIATYSISFKIGEHNVINSIVPKFGFNAGAGKTASARFQNNPDFYPVTSVAFSDSSSSPIDDFSVSFSSIMASNEGNGIPSGGGDANSIRYVYYTEAFLFNERDDLFSIIKMNPAGSSTGLSGFVKDPSTAYLLTWQLSVDPN